LWEVNTGREVWSLALPWTPRSLKFSPANQAHVYSANGNGTVTLLDLSEQMGLGKPNLIAASPQSHAHSESRPSARPLKVFFSYSHRDDEFREELITHMAALQREGLVETWNDRQISGGKKWKGCIDDNLKTADIVLLLVSADFIRSRYCWDIEMREALVRQKRGETRVIPILLRECDWEIAPVRDLNPLPAFGKAVTDFTNRDAAWKAVVKGLRAVIAELRRSGSS
jgi:hypothetical protein